MLLLVILVDVTVFGRSNSISKTKFHTNRTTRGDDMISHYFQDGSRSDIILLPVSCLIMSLSSECQHLSANQILSTYLNPRLRYK